MVGKDLTRPNGVAVSNDQKTLYGAISDRSNPRIMAYDIVPDGGENGRVFFDGNELSKNNVGSFDGLKVHPSGTVSPRVQGVFW